MTRVSWKKWIAWRSTVFPELNLSLRIMLKDLFERVAYSGRLFVERLLGDWAEVGVGEDVACALWLRILSQRLLRASVLA